MARDFSTTVGMTRTRQVPVHDTTAIQVAARKVGIDDYRLRRFRNAFFKKSATITDAALEIPEGQRGRFVETIRSESLELVEVRHSKLDGASRILFKTSRGDLAETVILRIASGRTTLCLSSQSGCAAACAFCATGRMGLRAHLRVEEILDQVVIANRILRAEGRRARNLVFMGMGEPFQNAENVFDALEILSLPAAFDYSPSRILVSTVGIPDKMVEFARRQPKGNLALSLHSARQETRVRIIPIAARFPLEAIRDAVRQVNQLQADRPVFLEYLMLREITDSDAEMEALSRFAGELNCHINLIPFNAVDGLGFVGSDPRRIAVFSSGLKALGFKVTVRRSLGADIAAACGQLASDGLKRGGKPRDLSTEGISRGIANIGREIQGLPD
jgi:23S rRNA (adenine2503-C2)-methyltransferase